jgi:hypothetical protein
VIYSLYLGILWQHLTIDPITLQRLFFCGEIFPKQIKFGRVLPFSKMKLPTIFKLIVMFLDINVEASSQHIKGFLKKSTFITGLI